ncbi:MAG: fumarylacetoacetate hydrolase family protein [Sneathiella sp.]
MLITDPDVGDFETFRPEAGFAYAFGLTYADHIAETGQETPEKPIIFRKNVKPTTGQKAVVAPDVMSIIETIERIEPGLAEMVQDKSNLLSSLLDYEIELGIQVLEDCANEQITRSQELPKIGYFLANDVTSRAVQVFGELVEDRLPLWSASKSFDDFFPCGDTLWVPPATSREHLPDVTLELTVNGEVRQKEPTSNLIYTPRKLLELAATTVQDRTLKAGDLIITGTPAGVAFQVAQIMKIMSEVAPGMSILDAVLSYGRKEKAYLRPGDIVEMRAGWLGGYSFAVS